MVFENALTLKYGLVDLKLREKPSHFFGECLNAMFHLRMHISNSLHQQLEKKKRHFDGSFIYMIFPTMTDITVLGNVKVGLDILGKLSFFFLLFHSSNRVKFCQQKNFYKLHAL